MWMRLMPSGPGALLAKVWKIRKVSLGLKGLRRGLSGGSLLMSMYG